MDRKDDSTKSGVVAMPAATPGVAPAASGATHTVALTGSNVAVAVVGLSVGVLMGLSASPVVGSVIGGILAMATAALAILVGWKRPELGAIQMAPLACFTSLLVLGGLLGVWMRAHSLLAPGVVVGVDERQRQVAAWVALGIPEQTAVNAIFAKEFPLSPDVRALRITDPVAELQKWTTATVSSTVLGDAFVRFVYPPASSGAARQTGAEPVSVALTNTASALWNSRMSACDDLLTELDKQGSHNIHQALARSARSRWQALAVIEDIEVLQMIVSEDLCPPDQYRWPWEPS
jgi:hypothetical protein